METLFNILKKSRVFFAVVALIAAAIGMSMNSDPAYIVCMVFIGLALVADVVVLVLHRKLNIPVKYHENMYKFKKRK